MKIKELIEKLQEIEAKEGDVEILLGDTYGNLIENVAIGYDVFLEACVINEPF